MTKSRSRTSRLFPLETAAERINCSTRHIRRLIANGQLRVVDIAATGNRPKLRIREDDLEDYIESRTVSVQAS